MGCGIFTLTKMLSYSVESCNRTLCAKISEIVKVLAEETDVKHIVYGASELIEHNPYLLKYADEECMIISVAYLHNLNAQTKSHS